MKLRIKGNSVRLRLLRSEVERFAAEGVIADETLFGGSKFRYSLRSSAETDRIEATFVDGEISIILPREHALEWANGEAVGTEAEQGELSILIEKDFVCVDRPDDPDRADAYPNPQVSCSVE
jgi:hypothetical protein